MSPPPIFESRRLAWLLNATIGLVFPLLLWKQERLLRPLLSAEAPLLLELTGIVVLGVLCGAAMARKIAPRFVSVAAALASLAVVAPYALGDRIAVGAWMLSSTATAGPGYAIVSHLVIIAVVALPSAITWGLLASLAARTQRGALRALGAGTLIGLLAVAMNPARALSVLDLWHGLLALATLIAGLALFGTLRVQTPLTWVGTIVPLVLTVSSLYLSPGPSSFWRHFRAADATIEPPTSRNDLRRKIHQQRAAVDWTTDGLTASIGFERDGCGYRLDGTSRGGLHDAPGEIMSALIGAALHGSPQRALVLGLESGASAGWLADVPSIEEIRVVEREPALLALTEHCQRLNRDVLFQPKVELTFGAHRAALREDPKWDLILASPPVRRLDGRLVAAAASRLEAGGLFLQRVRESDTAALEVVEKHFAAVEVWHTQPDEMLLVAGHQAPEPQGLDELLTRDPFATALDLLWGLEGYDGFFAGRLQPPPPIKSLADLRAARALAWQQPVADSPARRAFQQSDLQRALLDWARRGTPPTQPIDRLLVAEASAELADERVPDLVAPLAQRRPVETELVLARWQMRQRNPAAALQHLEQAFEKARATPWVYPPTLRRGLELAIELAGQTEARELSAALEKPFAVDLLRNGRLRTALAMAGPGEGAAVSREFEPHVPWEEDFLTNRLMLYEQAGHALADRARQDLEQFRRAAPSRLEDGLLNAESSN